MVQKKEASICFQQGMQMLHGDRLEEALDAFSKAIKYDPHYAEAYRNRGEVFNLLRRVVEANTDLQKAKSLAATAVGSSSPKKVTRTVQKYDLKSAESIYDDLLASDFEDAEDDIDFGGQSYDYVFSDDTLESDNLLARMADSPTKQQDFPAILEYLDGKREEVLITRLFGPAQDEITLAYGVEGGEKIISLEQLSCIRLARVPAGFVKNKDASCHVEVIETFAGSIYHESILSEQVLKNALYGFSTKNDSRFKYTLIPRSSIKKRYQRRHLGQILLDKGLVAGDILKHALEEHAELKTIKFGKVIAQHARILYSAVEFEIQRSFHANQQGLKIGEILLNAGLVNEEQILAALEYQEGLKNRKLGQFLMEKGILQEKDVYMALAEKFRIPFVDLRQQKVTRTILGLLPREVIQRLMVMPIAVREGALVVATMQPDSTPICELVLKHSPSRNVEFVLVQPSHLKNVIKVLFQQKE